MVKCIVDDKSLKQIQSKVGLVLRSYLKNKEPMSTLKVKMRQLFNGVASQYEIDDIDKIVDIIHKSCIRYGAVDQDKDFFSSQNITNLIIAQKEGINVNDPREADADNLIDAQQARIRLDASREFLDDSYGSATNVSEYVIRKSNRNIFDCLFINRGSVNQPLGIVKTNIELNRNIRQYQEVLLRRITRYLSQVVKNAPNLHTTEEIKQLLLNPSLYQEINGEIEYTGILESISYLSNMFLSRKNFNDDVLRQLFNDMNDSTLSSEIREEARQKLEAYNAKVILTHFDTYLALTLGKTIKIRDFNQKTGKEKYQISGKTAKLVTTWRKSENIFVEDEADMITKLAINTTPLVKWQYPTTINDDNFDGKFITFQDFEHTIAKIKDLVYKESAMIINFDEAFIENNPDLWRGLSQDTKQFLQGKRLSTAINYIRRNPRKYLHSIFELLTNQDFYDLYSSTIYANFTQDELNKLYSISRGIFNGDNSINELVDLGTDLNADYYSYITQTADAVFNIHYLQYYVDQDGIIQIRTLIDQSINNIRRSLEQTINTSNSGRLIKDFNEYSRNLDLKPDSKDNFKSISFNIPNTNITVKVVASSGSVYIYDNSTNQQITDFVQLWNNDDIRQFVDNTLHLNISKDTMFQEALYDIQKGWGTLCKNLLQFSSRVILNQYVSNELLKDKTITDKEAIIDKVYGRNAPRYNYALDELGLIHGNDIKTLKDIANAKANLFGLTTSSQVKDGKGNGQSLFSLSRLIGSLQSQFDLQEMSPYSATNGLMLLTIPGLYEGIYTAKELYNQSGDTKEVKEMSVSEMSYAGIVHDFIKGFIDQVDSNDLVGNGHVLFLPSVNSDKGTIGRIRINLNKLIEIRGQKKAIKQLSSDELEEVISAEFGNFYTKVYRKIVADWSELNSFIHSKNITLPFNLADDFKNGFENFNRYFYENITELSQYGNSPADFIKHFVLEYNKTSRLNPLELIDQVHYKSKNGNLGINESILAQIARFNPDFIKTIKPELLDKYPSSSQFWTLKKSEVLKTLLKNNFKIDVSKVEQPELAYIRKHFPDWINPSGNLILARASINGRLVEITSNRDLIKIGSKDINGTIDSVANNLVLNPILEQYNYLEYLFTQEFMNCTVGSFIAHPVKGTTSNVLQQEAAQFQAQHKRNVSFTASMHPFQLNLLNGIPEYYNIAVIDDLYDQQGTVGGQLNKIKVFDGATFVNPFVVLLENNSLGGARAGITKKQFVHFKSEKTGTGGIIKTAGFGMTNDWIRNSPFLAKMMKKMTDHTWLDQTGVPAVVDITEDFRGNKITYKDFFFKKGGKYYQIVNITSLGNNQYTREIQEVTIDGNPIKQITENPPQVFTIDSNYKLWNFFGGMNSMTKEGNFLKMSNTSVENVVTAMNNIGFVINNKVRTQDDLWQPLKQVDIHYVATAGAVKQGGANINSNSKYEDDQEYDFQRVRMYQAGIQLDKEHSVDEAELSLMTQVISACASQGYTFDAAVDLYNALRKLTEINTQAHLDTVRNLFTDGSQQSINQFQEILVKSIVKSLGSKQKSNRSFVEIIASDLIKRAKEGKEIQFSEVLLPLSDNTVYAKVFSTITSFLTNTGIKQKIDGTLSVLTPSHQVYKLWADRKYESFTNPEQELAELQLQQIPLYDSLFDFSEIDKNLVDVEIYDRSLTPGYNNKALKIYLKGQHEKGWFELVKDNEDNFYSVHFKTAKDAPNTLSTGEIIQPSSYEERSILWDQLRKAIPNGAYVSTYGSLTEDGVRAINKLGRTMETSPETRLAKMKNSDEQISLPIFIKPGNKNNNAVSNLELGREYFITRNIIEESIDDDGNIIQTLVNETKSELIRTPAEYKKLKQDITSGKVTRVVENIQAGRNLAGYNVRFSSDTGERFQLWDLDSASTLFELDELKKKWKGSAIDVSELSGIAQRLFGNTIIITQENAEDLLPVIETRTRRLLQNDLENLSLSSQETKEQYQKLLSTKQNTPKWYKRYTNWVNVKLGRGDGNKLFIRGQYYQVNSKNFDQIQDIVSRMMDTSTKVRINGVFHTINKSSISVQPYEIIMAKKFATSFGLNEFDDLNTIKNDKDFFIKQYLKNQATKVNNNQYTVELKVSNGNHHYLLTKQQLIGSELHKITPLVMTMDGKTYRLDSDSNIMYEISPDTEIYVDKLGNEVIVTDDLEFYINSLSYDSIKLSDKLTKYPNIVENIANILKDSSNKVAVSYYKYITKQGDSLTDIMAKNNKYHSVTLQNYTSLSPDNPIIKQGRIKHTSFLKSLEVIAARIPAQSMQSYMPMKVVAYDNPDINSAYVSTYQLLLQGSDYDIDAVSIATYSINENGELEVWSPYSRTDNIDLLSASMQLPIPTGKNLEIQEANDYTNPFFFLQKYKDILSISQNMIYDKKTKQYEPDPDTVKVNLTLNTEEQIILLGKLLQEVKFLTRIPSSNISQLQRLAANLTNSGLVTFKFQRPSQVLSIFSEIENIVNRHNQYFDKIPLHRLSNIISNHTMYSMYRTGIDPVNLVQAQTPIDSATGPLKKEAEKSLEGREAKVRTPGNAFNKFESIHENQVGSQGIGICAVGLKTYFGLTQYNNYILNYGTVEQQKRLLLGNNHLGYIIGKKRDPYKILANIRSKDPNSITNDDVLEALASTTNDYDAAIILSALLSLATDNAKELALSKLNAGSSTIGMYIYAVSIGMDFKEIARILMSEAGRVITSLLDSDAFSEREGLQRVQYVFNYFDEGPFRFLEKFNVTRDPAGSTINSPLMVFKNAFLEEYSVEDSDGNELPLAGALAVFGKGGYDLSYKLNILEQFRNKYNSGSIYADQLYNQLIDFIEDYVVQAHTIGQQRDIYEDIRILSEGAEEMRVLGQILGLNQGIKTNSADFLKQINYIERAIYDKTNNQEDLVDLIKFVFDEQYRQECIEKYEAVKHSFNIYDVVATIPHFMGYLQTAALALAELKGSYKFRSIKQLTLGLSRELNYKKEDKIAKGVQNYIGDHMRKEWMLSDDIQIVIPKENKAFDKNGNMFELTEDTPIKLGTDWGDATFRMFMENEVIPNLKKGIIKTSSDKDFVDISSNKFIQDLGNDLLTNTVSKNPSIIYTLPINMLPRVDQERTVFNYYKAEFNKLGKYSYQYQISSYDQDGNPQIQEKKISLVDLFTYYAMIADGWKLGEKSLVPILEDFQNTGAIKKFHDFESRLDKSGEYLTLVDVDMDSILPYIAPFDNPYKSRYNYIWHRNPTSRKIQLMRKLSRQELEMISEDQDNYGYYNPNIIRNFSFIEGDNIDLNYFSSGVIESNIRTVVHKYEDNGVVNFINVQYDVDSGKIEKIFINGTDQDIPEGLTTIPFIKVNGRKKENMQLVESLIKNYNNPC